MGFQKVQMTLTGVAPLLMHNGLMADPANPLTRAMKEISAKRKKVDADFEALANIEWRAGLYISGGKIVIPSNVLEATLTAASKKTRQGKQAQAGLFVESDCVLQFPDMDTPLTELEKMPAYRLSVGVRVQLARIIRTRPKFDVWSITPTIVYDDQMFNRESVKTIAATAGDIIGMCDWRPKYGRFTVTF